MIQVLNMGVRNSTPIKFCAGSNHKVNRQRPQNNVLAAKPVREKE